jgi:hypothetical protein
LLTTSQTTHNLIGEAIGLRVELAATGEMGQGAELAINGGVKTTDNQVIGVIGRDAADGGGGGILHGGLSFLAFAAELLCGFDGPARRPTRWVKRLSACIW